jgi:Uma2 family endonuclease
VDNSPELSPPRATLDTMTALPVPPSSARLQPMTAAEYAALPEDTDHDYELQDGHFIMSAKPIPKHQRALLELGVQLRPQVPEHLQLLLGVDLADFVGLSKLGRVPRTWTSLPP